MACPMSSLGSIRLPSLNLQRPRLALAISPDERTAFLQSHLDRLNASTEVVDATAGSNSVIENLLQQEPEILISAWSTPWLEPLLLNPRCRLKYVCHLTGSVRNVVPRAFIEKGGRVTNWGTLPNLAVAEHALLLALAILRNLPGWSPFAAGPRSVSATRALGTQTLCGRRIGIHGFGGVAQALVRILKPFTGSIASYSAGVPAEFMRAHGVEPVNSLGELCAQSEVFFECEALTPATRRSIAAPELARLPGDAVFVNVARGDLVDEEALIREASAGRIRVALDVIATEPLTPQSAVSRIKGAVLSPHIAGPTLDQYAQVGELAVANLERYVTGGMLQAEVTLEVYDRST